MEQIIAIITVYRRTYTLIKQVAALRSQTITPAAIWAFAQEPTEETLAKLSTLRLDRIITCEPNSYFHLRFAVAMTAQTRFVSLFDDDTIPGPGWFASCVATMRTHPGILGTAGIRVHLAGYEHRSFYGWPTPSADAHEVDYNGHGWFFEPRVVRHLFAESLATGTNGEDIELGARCLRLGGIRSYVPAHPADDRSVWGSVDALHYGNDAVASWRRDGYFAERFGIIQAEMAAGWRPICARMPCK